MEIKRPGVERLGKWHDGCGRDQADIGHQACNEHHGCSIEITQRHEDAGCIIGDQKQGQPAQMRRYPHQKKCARDKPRGLHPFPCKKSPTRHKGTQEQEHPMGLIFVGAEQFHSGPADQHTRPDQRGGIAKHAIGLTAARQYDQATRKGQSTEDSHIQRIRQPKDQPCRGRNNPETQHRVDREADHRFARARLDLTLLVLRDHPIGQQLLRICNRVHRRLLRLRCKQNEKSPPICKKNADAPQGWRPRNHF